MRHLEVQLKNKIPVYGIINIHTKKWVLDCFDDPRLFAEAEEALDYKTKCLDYNNDNFKVETWDYGVNNE